MSTTTYLDHAATTSVLPEVVEVVARVMGQVGNASSTHGPGRHARSTVEESREDIAEALGVHPTEVVFTSGGTESDNIAVTGSFLARRAADPDRTRVVTTGLEHHAVLDSVEHLVAGHGARVTWVEPTSEGVITPQALQAALEEGEGPADVAVVSVMWANNEIGTVQDIPALAEVCRAVGVPLHTDAVQALGQVELPLAGLGSGSAPDLVALTGHKIGGPVGVGLLLAARGQKPEPALRGGGQERGLRPGTLPVASIAGLATAVRYAVEHRAEHATRVAALRDSIIEGALGLDPSIVVSGPWASGDTTRRLPGNAHLQVPGADSDALLYLLDTAGIACSAGSACTAGVTRPSHVLLACGIPEDRARGALRLSLGRTSTEDDVARLLAALPDALQRARLARAAS
ncbi:cysteine desulfurase family protein [Ornithinimicrobium pratense]|uniref:Cysteine desulfurase n=1 Tax=Ornithinimicrobium pratense TaxID=2593973 RepID=A0A5J6V3X3_9MICO|nr:cysteine desulfurase family protein [Ornithinimicrobium pratense]QFG67861.1 cysteine desulfurase [Ornithinimicrobium pratense]